MGQADGTYRCPVLPEPGPPPPAGAYADAQGLHLSEALALTSFPRTQGAQGRGREEQPGEKGTEIRMEGGLEAENEHWGQNWEFLGLPQLQGLCPTISPQARTFRSIFTQEENGLGSRS